MSENNKKKKPAAPQQNEELEALKASLEEKDTLIAAKEQTIAEQKDQYLRLCADFDNFRRNAAKARLELLKTASEDVLSGILPVLDNFDSAIKALKEAAEPSTAAIEGTELIYQGLMNYLQSKGLKRIESLGAEFDVDFHDAVTKFPVEEPEKKNHVIDVIQQGYMLDQKVIRYAKVVVGV
ncbi:MAG: nucleotide exchange factor GrpE [Bacteroidales bacterium]|mgnify:CR=1 FL=1|nr:nucleotide exchange factor GrpE [Bacteroidales bacterium]